MASHVHGEHECRHSKVHFNHDSHGLPAPALAMSQALRPCAGMCRGTRQAARVEARVEALVEARMEARMEARVEARA